MKSCTLLLLSFLSLSGIAATTNALAGNVKIHGKITNPLSEEIKFATYDGRLDFTPHEFTAKVDKGGNFAITFPVVEQYTDIIFQHGDQGSEIFLKDGDDVTMTLDGKDFDKTMHYTGKGADEANFSAKHVLDIGMQQQFGTTVQPLMVKSADEFLSASKEALQKELDFLEANKTGLPTAFVNYWRANYTYNLYYFMQSYPYLHEMYKSGSSTVQVPMENYKVAMAVPQAFNDEYMGISNYRTYVSDYFGSKGGGTDSIARAMYQLHDSANILAKKLMTPKSKEFYFANKLYRGMKQSTVSKADSEYTEFKKMYPKSEYADVLDKSMALKRKLGAGQPALEFAFTTLDGKKMKLSDLKGKVVFLDFWASWCGPCMRELPPTRKVEEHFKGKDIVFLNVSIDEDQEAWKKAIDKNKIEGIHTCQPGGWKSPIAAKYGIQSVPSYFLIDKNGKFVTETTPRPSETANLIALIETALK